MIFLLTHRDAVRIRRCRRATLAGAVLLAQAMWSPEALAQSRDIRVYRTVATPL